MIRFNAAGSPLIGIAALLAGCAGTPVQDSPPSGTSPPPDWTASTPHVLDPPEDWLSDFDAPHLKSLVAAALEFNHDLQAAAARIAAARARAEIAGAERRPVVNAELTGTRSQRRDIVVDTTATTHLLEATVAWEIDLWGRLNDTARAAVAEAEAVTADYRAARLLLAADVARLWFTVIEANLQVQLTERSTDNFRRSLRVIEERYRAGLNSSLDVRLARENVANAEANLAARLRERDAARRALDVLLGNYPAGAIASDDGLPALRDPVPAGLPAALLARRPDLVAAELRLSAAGERLGAARKNRLPAVRLTASGGNVSDEFNDLLRWDNLVWSLVGGITQPLFQGGRLAAEQALARADHREAWAGYAQSVLTAFREVETALAAETYYVEQEAALQRASVEADAAAELALQRYRQGLVDIITLLESQRRAFDTESARLRTARERLNNRITLYLALGGDFGDPFELAGGPRPGTATQNR